MKAKFNRLSTWSFVLAVVIFILSFFVFHYVTPDLTISPVFQKEAGKPLVCQLLSTLGVLFLFSGILCRMISAIFFDAEND